MTEAPAIRTSTINPLLKEFRPFPLDTSRKPAGPDEDFHTQSMIKWQLLNCTMQRTWVDVSVFSVFLHSFSEIFPLIFHLLGNFGWHHCFYSCFVTGLQCVMSCDQLECGAVFFLDQKKTKLLLIPQFWLFKHIIYLQPQISSSLRHEVWS